MKHLLAALLLLPGGLLAQVRTTTVPPTTVLPTSPARDTSATTHWTLSLEASQRSIYLGREYGNKAFSLAPSLSYSHPSGFYGTVSGYYFNQSEPPHYAFTDLELGYANDFTDAWTYSVSLDRVFFTPPISATDKLIPNGLEAYTDYRLGSLRAALDYTFFFGKSSAQTITLGLSNELKKEHWLGLDAVSLAPGAEVLWGSPLALARYGGTYTAATAGTTTVHGRRKQQALQAAAADAQTVRLLGYELTLPLKAERGALAYTLTGHYIIPRRTADDPATPLPTRAYLSLQVDFSF